MTTVLPHEWVCQNCGARLVWGINHYEPCCNQQEPVQAPIHYREEGKPRWEQPFCKPGTWLNTESHPGRVTCCACRALLEQDRPICSGV